MTDLESSPQATEYLSESGVLLHRHAGVGLLITHMHLGFRGDDHVYEVLSTTRHHEADGMTTLAVTVRQHPPGYW